MLLSSYTTFLRAVRAACHGYDCFARHVLAALEEAYQAECQGYFVLGGCIEEAYQAEFQAKPTHSRCIEMSVHMATAMLVRSVPHALKGGRLADPVCRRELQGGVDLPCRAGERHRTSARPTAQRRRGRRDRLPVSNSL